MSRPAPTAEHRRRRGDRGAVIPIVALCLPILIIMTAFAVDLGRQRSSRRTMQARADVIALDMVRIIGGRTEGQIKADPATEQAVLASAARNEIQRAKITLEWGTWNGAFVQTLDNAVPNAVEVRAQEDIDYFFQPGGGHAERTAVATSEGIAEFSIGSYAAGLQSKDSAFLGYLIGDSFNTTLVGYGGLVDNDISMRLLGEELVLLGAIGSPEEVFTADVGVNDLYLASANALRRSSTSDPDDVAAATLFEQYSTQIPGGYTVPMGSLFHVEQGGEEAALDSSINALDLLSTSAFLANGSNALGAPSVSLGLPLIGQVTSQCSSLDPPSPSPCNAVRVIEGPVRVRGPVGAAGSTRQVAVRVGFQGGLAPLINAKTQVSFDSAVGRGDIEAIRCGAPTQLQLGIETGLLEAEVIVTGTLVVAGFNVGVTLQVQRGGGGTADHPTFLMPDDAGTVFEGGGGDIGLHGLTVTSSVDTNLVPKLLLGTVNALLGPILSNLTNNVVGNQLLAAVDSNLLNPISNLFGLNIAGADVVPLDADCTNARLVR